jgi:hypothetical protein
MWDLRLETYVKNSFKGFSASFVLIEILDHVIAWFLAGLAIAAFIKKQRNA